MVGFKISDDYLGGGPPIPLKQGLIKGHSDHDYDHLDIITSDS